MNFKHDKIPLAIFLLLSFGILQGQHFVEVDSIQWELEMSKQVYAATLEELKHNQTTLKEAHLHLIKQYDNLSYKYRDTYAFDSALYYLNIGKTIHEKIERFDRHQKELWMSYHKTSARLFDNIAHSYYMKGHFDLAVRNRKKSFDHALIAFKNDPLRLFDYYWRLGFQIGVLGEPEESIKYYKKALSLIEGKTLDLEKVSYWDIGYVTEVIGYSYFGLKQYDLAISYLEKAFDIFENKKPISYEGQINTLRDLSLVYIAKNDLDTALKLTSKADSIWQANRQARADNYYFMGREKKILSNYGVIWKALGNLEKAKEYFKKVFQLYEKEGYRGDITTLEQIADIYFLQGNIDSAFYYNELGMRISHKKPNDFQGSVIPKVEDLKGETDIHSLLSQKAGLLALEALKESQTEKKKKLFEEALATINLGDEIHLNNLKKINILRGGQSKSVIESSTSIYNKGLSIFCDYIGVDDSKKVIDQGFYYAQKKKSQMLWLTLLNSEAVNFANIDKSLLEKERSLLTDINYYEGLVVKAKAANDSTKINLYENQYLFKAKKEYASLQETLEKEYPEYYESKYAFSPATGSKLQQLLQKEELLIEYVILDTTLLAFTIAQDQPLQITKIPWPAKSRSEIQALHNLLQNSPMLRKSSREKFIQLSHSLYRQFVQAIENQFPGKERLIIIGDGLTHYIPFEVLVKSNATKAFNELEYLIRDYEISYHYSSSLFAQVRRKEITGNTGFFAFAPVYDDNNSNVLAMRSNNGIDSSLRAFDNDGSYSPLPESETEVKSIFNLFNEKRNKAENKMFLRKNANETTLKLNLEKPYQFIHIAGHSFANIENPKFSGIACYQEDNIDSTAIREDGTLYTGEIYNIKSKADLVTLSSCESGFGKLETSEGILGLNRAFIYAGTSNVVFSLWKVYDKVSANLMVDFYKNVLEGRDYSNSLRAAKLKLLQNETTASPHFWSPFLLIGR